MSRANLPIIKLDVEAVSDHSAGVSINSQTAFEIDAGGDTEKLLVRLEHTTASEKVLTFKAPAANPHAPRSPLGDLAITMATGSGTRQVHAIVIESARFAQADGKINIDVAASTTGAIWVYRLPRGA